MIRAATAAITIAIALAFAAPASADPRADPRADVLAVVTAALTAINTNDAVMFKKLMLSQAIIAAQIYQVDGSLVTRTMSVADMADRIAAPGRHIDEQLVDSALLIQRDLAHVWARYTLDSDGRRLHCGVDSFGLVRLDGVWRISSLTWTAEPQGCPK